MLFNTFGHPLFQKITFVGTKLLQMLLGMLDSLTTTLSGFVQYSVQIAISKYKKYNRVQPNTKSEQRNIQKKILIPKEPFICHPMQ